MKKACFGYKKSEVEEKLAELQEIIRMNESRIAVFEERHAKMLESAAEKDRDLGIMAEELARYVRQGDEAARKPSYTQSRVKNAADTDQIYSLAYNTALSMLNSARYKAEEIVNAAAVYAKEADEHAKKTLSDITQIKHDLQAAIYGVKEKSDALLAQSDEYTAFNKPLSANSADILSKLDSQMRDCLLQIQKYKDESALSRQDSVKPRQETVSCVEAVEPAQRNITVNGTPPDPAAPAVPQDILNAINEYIKHVVNSRTNKPEGFITDLKR